MDTLLERIQSPSHLRELSRESLQGLANDLRERLIETVSQTGGHFSSNLGTIELTIALHRVFETPDDQFVFDVAHQGYVHKLLTGRADRIHTIRTYKGLNGFLLRSESEHDAYGAGHAGTALSAALGHGDTSGCICAWCRSDAAGFKLAAGPEKKVLDTRTLLSEMEDLEKTSRRSPGPRRPAGSWSAPGRPRARRPPTRLGRPRRRSSSSAAESATGSSGRTRALGATGSSRGSRTEFAWRSGALNQTTNTDTEETT